MVAREHSIRLVPTGRTKKLAQLRDRAAIFAHTGAGDPPPELTEINLCEMYHCLPSQLDDEDYERILRHIIVKNEVARSQSIKQKVAGGGGGGRKTFTGKVGKL